jgi:hypothetical protein
MSDKYPPFRAGEKVQDRETGERGVVRLVDGTCLTIEMPAGLRLVRFWDALEGYRRVMPDAPDARRGQ